MEGALEKNRVEIKWCCIGWTGKKPGLASIDGFT
jgi:hypothetical protein